MKSDQAQSFSVRTAGPHSMRLLLYLGSAACLVSRSNADDFFNSNNRGSNQITAVSSKTSDDYIRVKLPDGSFQPETYAFGRGGYYSGFDHDSTIQEMGFDDVTRTIAPQLANQNYFPSKDPNSTKLLIMVYWGTTAGPAQNATQFPSAKLWRIQLDRNASLLGYDEDVKGVFDRVNCVLDWKKRDLVEDIELNRYFVVLMAYDFPLLWKERKHELLWETRFSLREIGHDFGKEFPAMAQYASQYFGQDTHGLIRKIIPEGRVEIGETKSLGDVAPEK
jgi:hypothetical protein